MSGSRRHLRPNSARPHGANGRLSSCFAFSDSVVVHASTQTAVCGLAYPQICQLLGALRKGQQPERTVEGASDRKEPVDREGSQLHQRGAEDRVGRPSVCD